MKHFGIIALSVALSVVSCAKLEKTVAPSVISFQTAQYATKADIVGTAFPTTETFSVYAWTDGTAGTYFMDNETVSYQSAENKWLPSSTYYWPKNSPVDFFCYYPTGMTGINVTENQISYLAYDVENSPLDIMYSDKAVGYSDNMDEVEDNLPSGYTGVPIIFRHALSKVRVKAVLVYSHKEEADGTVTDWEVTVNSASLGGMFKIGHCVLNLESAPSSGLVKWVKPTDSKGYNVWTVADSTLTATPNYIATPITMVPGSEEIMVPETFVLPQSLEFGRQKVVLNLTIKTKRNGTDFLSETFNVVANLYMPELPAWQMNHVITYLLNISPTNSSGKGGDPSDPTDPSNPVDPNDPDLSDAIITFDPAVDGWDNIDVVAKINI